MAAGNWTSFGHADIDDVVYVTDPNYKNNRGEDPFFTRVCATCAQVALAHGIKLV